MYNQKIVSPNFLKIIFQNIWFIFEKPIKNTEKPIFTRIKFGKIAIIVILLSQIAKHKNQLFSYFIDFIN